MNMNDDTTATEAAPGRRAAAFGVMIGGGGKFLATREESAVYGRSGNVLPFAPPATIGAGPFAGAMLRYVASVSFPAPTNPVNDRKETAMPHRFISSDGALGCIVCGATFLTDAEGDTYREVTRCTGRTDLTHGDVHESGHALDCTEAAEDDVCVHVDPLCGCDACG